jgi:hypothetical protein
MSSQAPIDPRRQDRLLFGAVLLFFGAVVAVLYGLGDFLFPCGDQPCDRTLPLVQLLVSLIGLVPAYLMVRNVNRGRTREAGKFLLIGLMIYFVWAALNNAAVYGW